MADTLLQVETEAIVTVVSFHPEDSTLLAYGTIHGEIYIRELLPGEPVDTNTSVDSEDYDWDNRNYPRAVLRASTKCHSGAVRSIDWHTARTLNPSERSTESEGSDGPDPPVSYLLTSGADGTVAVVKLCGESGLGLTKLEQTEKVAEIAEAGESPIAGDGSVDTVAHPELKLTDEIRFDIKILSVAKMSEHAIRSARLYNVPVNLAPRRKERKKKAYEARLALETADPDQSKAEPLKCTMFLLLGDDNGDIQVFSLARSEEDRVQALERHEPFSRVQTLTDAGDFIAGIVYGPDRHQVFVTAGDGTVYIYQYSPTKKLFVLVDNSSPEMEDYQCISTNFGRESHILVGSANGHVAVYNPRDIALRTTLIKVRSRSVEEIVFLRQGMFVVGCGNGSVKLIDCSPPRLLGTLSQPFRSAISALAAAPDLSVIACAAYTNSVCILDTSWIAERSEGQPGASDTSEDSNLEESERGKNGESREGDDTQVSDSLDSMAHVAEPGSITSSTDSDSESAVSDAVDAVLEAHELDDASASGGGQASQKKVRKGHLMGSLDAEDRSEDSIDVFSPSVTQEPAVGQQGKTTHIQIGDKALEVRELRKGVTKIGEHMKVIEPGCIDNDSSFDEFFAPKRGRKQVEAPKRDSLSKGTRAAKRKSFFSDV